MDSKRSQFPFIIGLCGGIASGKSVVANELERLGALVIRADQIGHQVLAEEDVKRRLIEFFGVDIKDTATGELSRPKIASLVFGNSSKAQENLRFLESVTHPRIRERILQKLHDLKTQENAPQTVVLDIPLLLESGWDTICQQIIFVATPESLRIQNASKRGWSQADYLARQAMQMPLPEKEKRSSVVFTNAGTLEDLQAKVSKWYQEVLQKLPE